MIDPAARVDAAADLDSAATVAPGAAVEAGARVGAGSSIGAGALVGRGVVVEEDVTVGHGAIVTGDRHPRVVRSVALPEGVVPAGPLEVRLARGCSVAAGAVVSASVGSFATVEPGAVVTEAVPAHALVAGNPAERVGWACACGRQLLDGSGAPAPAQVERYAIDPFLGCGACGRRYVYVPDGDTLEERRGPALHAGATA